MEFFFPVRAPTSTSQQKRLDTRGSKPRFFLGRTLKAQRNYFCSLLKQSGMCPETPMDGPLLLKYMFFYAPLPQKYRKRGMCRYKDTRPDWDNVSKTFTDCMVDVGFIANDARVSIGMVTKLFAPWHGIQVRLDRIKDEYVYAENPEKSDHWEPTNMYNICYRRKPYDEYMDLEDVMFGTSLLLDNDEPEEGDGL